MTVHQEASNPWLFESHNNSKRSQWLQATLSGLEEKTKGMLKLIESDADTFAQRAEMYYKKRPELMNMIEDFYRSYRSLAERYDQLKLESGNAFPNRGFLPKQWSFTDKSCSSSVTFDSESEVDDPSEEDQVESKLRELPRNKNYHNLVNLKHAGTEILKVMTKRERSDQFAYSTDSELSEVYFPSAEEFPLKKGDTSVAKDMIEKVESSKASNAEDNCFEHINSLYETKTEFPGEENMVAEAETVECKIKRMPENASQPCFENLKQDDDELKLMTEVKRLKDENTALKAELERKEDEKREVTRQLSLSKDMLKLKLKEEGDISLSGHILLFQEADQSIQYKIKKMSELSPANSYDHLKKFHPLSNGTAQAEKHNDEEVKELMNEVKRLKKENVAFKVELESKDEEKREVIRQLSLSMDILRGENDSMRKFIRDSKNKTTSPFELRELKGVFVRKLFGSPAQSPTALVAI